MPDNTKLFSREHQIALDDLDITYAPDGMTLSGHLKAAPGEDGADKLRQLARLLLQASYELDDMEPVEIEEPKKVDPKFGRAFDI